MKKTAFYLALCIVLPPAAAHASSGTDGSGLNFLGWYLLSRVALIGIVLLVMFGFKKKKGQ